MSAYSRRAIAVPQLRSLHSSVVRNDKKPHSDAHPPAAMTAIRQHSSASDRLSSFATRLLQSDLS